MLRSKWKSPYINKNLLNKLRKKNLKEIYVYSRGSTILKPFIVKNLYIYQGNKYSKINVVANMVGYKMGQFSFTRKIGKIHQTKIK